MIYGEDVSFRATTVDMTLDKGDNRAVFRAQGEYPIKDVRSVADFGNVRNDPLISSKCFFPPFLRNATSTPWRKTISTTTASLCNSTRLWRAPSLSSRRLQTIQKVCSGLHLHESPCMHCTLSGVERWITENQDTVSPSGSWREDWQWEPVIVNEYDMPLYEGYEDVASCQDRVVIRLVYSRTALKKSEIIQSQSCKDHCLVVLIKYTDITKHRSNSYFADEPCRNCQQICLPEYGVWKHNMRPITEDMRDPQTMRTNQRGPQLDEQV